MDFRALAAIRRQIEGIRARQTHTLLHYAAKEYVGWVHEAKPDGKASAQSASKASSTTVLAALLAGTGLKEYCEVIFSLQNSGRRPKKADTTIVRTKLLTGLHTHLCGRKAGDANSAGLSGGNPFTIGHLVPAVHALEGELSPKPTGLFTMEDAAKLLARSICLGWDLGEYDARRSGAANATKAEVDDDEQQASKRAQRGSISIQGYPPNAYLTHLAIRALWKTRGPPTKPITCSPHAVESKAECQASNYWDVRSQVQAWCVHEMRRQLALELHHELDADVMQLAYAAAAWAIATDGVPRDPEEVKLAELAISTFLEAQNEHGAWPRSNPIFHYPRVGNAYCYDFELLTSLLEPEVREPLKEALLQHVGKLAQAVERLVRTAQEVSPGVFAWPSGHHPLIKGPESWTTASVFHFLFNLDLLLAEALRRSVFAALERPYAGSARPFVEADGNANWTEFWDCPRDISKPEGPGIRDYLQSTFASNVRNNIARVNQGLALPKPEDGVITSAILYGPPGTSKSRIAKNLAESIGWRVLEIDPSHFAKKGLDQVPAEVDRIFDMLGEMEEVVIFVDEFDEMVRERGSDPESFSRMLTTIMLPKLQRIGDRRRCLILMATNHLEQFDAAIRRPGRFDAIIPVLPPTWREKSENLADTPGAGLVKQLADADLPLTIGKQPRKPTEILGALTFLEFKDLERELKQLTKKEDVEVALTKAGERCVMYSIAREKPERISWHALMVEEQGHARLP